MALQPHQVRELDPGRQDDRTAQPPQPAFARNQVWYEIVALACESLAKIQMLVFTESVVRRKSKRLRLRLFAVAGRLVRSDRRPDCRPSDLSDQSELSLQSGREPSRVCGTPPTRRDSGI